jgi:hypothetical protein
MHMEESESESAINFDTIMRNSTIIETRTEHDDWDQTLDKKPFSDPKS